jgi:hypothetical protein
MPKLESANNTGAHELPLRFNAIAVAFSGTSEDWTA